MHGPHAELLQADAERVVTVLHAFAHSPHGLGGLCLRAWAGPRRAQLIDWCRRALCESSGQKAAGSGQVQPAWTSLPHHADPAQLESGVDIGLSLSQGRPVRVPGLLDRAVPPIVVVSMAERMSLALGAALAGALDAGRLVVILLDESLEDEAGPWSGLSDRVAVHLDLRDEALLAAVLEQLAPIAMRVGPRGLEPQMPSLPDALLKELVAAGLMLDVRSARPVQHAARLAQRLALQHGLAEVEGPELALAIRFALLPHARQLPVPSEPERESAEPEADSEPQHSDPADPRQEPRDGPDEDAGAPGEPPSDPGLPDGAAERLIEAALATLPADMLAALANRSAQARGRAAAAGAGQLTAQGRGRGRSIGARRGFPNGAQRLHVFATLRAAIPWQRLRVKALPASAGSADPAMRPRVQLRKDDLHVHREWHRRGTTTVFVVDASGSTALQRLNEAKGAVELLLADCYVRRDRVALVAFRGRGAEVLLAPTRSLVAARRALSALPGGGGSPVAAGLELAARLVMTLNRAGDDSQVVVLTDGRANLTRDGRPGRQDAVREAQTMARQLARVASQRVLIDTSLRPEPAARALADALEARYCPMPFARAESIRAAIG